MPIRTQPDPEALKQEYFESGIANNYNAKFISMICSVERSRSSLLSNRIVLFRKTLRIHWTMFPLPEAKCTVRQTPKQRKGVSQWRAAHHEGSSTGRGLFGASEIFCLTYLLVEETS
jgi:hypothetical protein